MANNQDDFETNQEAGSEFDDFKESSPLIEAWRNSPMLKFLAFGAAVLLVIGGIMMFGGSSDQKPPSRVSGAVGVTSVPGDDVDPQFEQALRAVDEQRIQMARERGGSALPTPIGRTRGVDELGANQQEDVTDPLEQWRANVERRQRERETEQRQQRAVQGAQQQQQQQQQQRGRSRDEADALAQAMASQFQAIMEGRTPRNSRVATITPHNYLEQRASTAGGATGTSGQGTGIAANDKVEEIVIPAGDIVYAQLVTLARSDVNTPVLAQIASGPLSGARAIGSFRRAQGNYLILNFNRLVVDGVDYPISAVAVDPQTTSGGMVTDVDYHWFSRVILPGAAAFIEGLADAYARRETTVTVSGDTVIEEQPSLNTSGKLATGIASSTRALGRVFQDEARDKREPTVIVAAGTPIGLFFTQPVVQESF